MMKIAFVVSPYFLGGRIFAEYDQQTNRDDCLRPFIELRKSLQQQGVDLATFDQIPLDKADAVLCLDMPKSCHPMWKIVAKCDIPVHVIALESPYIHTANANFKLIERCSSIFTWQDSWIDGIKFFPIYFAQKLRPPFMKSWASRKFACMVSSNKSSSHRNELYSRRLAVINWYDRYQPDLFDLFGMGWEIPAPSNLLMRMARRLPVLRSQLAPKLKVYRGTLQQKQETLSNYRFCFCYENFNAPDGWITEKIFDAMFAGCVPVYWGPNNIEAHIPPDCYIDASKFVSNQALHAYLASLDDIQCDRITRAIHSYLSGEKVKEFSIEAFVATIEQRLIQANP